jgi:hypothetical protein
MKTVTIDALGKWWSVRLHCHCGCDQIYRVAIASTITAAVSKFRLAQRELRILQEVRP